MIDRIFDLIHLLLHRHRPLWERVPVGDYLDWTICIKCCDKR